MPKGQRNRKTASETEGASASAPPTPTTTGCYDASSSKKGPVLAVRFFDGGLLQFPVSCKYHFRNVAGDNMVVVKDSEGREIAHIKLSAVEWIAGPQWLIRDKDAH